ncbi:NAD(P)-dependent dehydrogenase (short-subunit alcohol dehydrogenase family) [Bacillus niacini]|jgi:NAD(P)-dependent dehydrogenase (short-subunit alcohol dehydrogenase family)|uniref:NAD(P)-dependent dehydrogenase (Short-subunit alcohol dehydrogenase family) n=2 Tax=Neobacillus TaxID=2675232 RepID=A0A852TNN7_9BACI|nr:MULTISPECIES: SDR family oxidoreductase [Neobacillus]MDP5197356.1 SDR family oxidoreductase [Neobacillus sp. 179.-C4.2 HS]NYE08604.1 NAD(P)-dependent dehydrogenase (short-subunit alcohol dehydrogenase family) [Neobacillus niacini]
MTNLFDLTGKTAVAIGGNGVLGSAMAKGLAEHGAKVAIVGRNLETAEKVVKEIVENGGEAKAFSADVSSKDSLVQVAKDIEQWSGGWDILLNAPGTNSPTPFFDLDMDEYDKIMDINLKGIVMTCQIFAKRMIEQERQGSIINISSVSSTTPLSRVFTYSVSKAGLNSVTQFLAREFATSGIRVNAIIPGFFPAEQNRKILDKERIESIMGHTPMKRFGEAEELQGATVFLASDKASSFVTGALIRVDGGFGAMTI